MSRKIPPGQLSFNLLGVEQLIHSGLSTNLLKRHLKLISRQSYDCQKLDAALEQVERSSIAHCLDTSQGTWIVRFAGRTKTNRRSWDVYFRGNSYCAV
jgi:hypothetical protein